MTDEQKENIRQNGIAREAHLERIHLLRSIVGKTVSSVSVEGHLLTISFTDGTSVYASGYEFQVELDDKLIVSV